MASTYPSRTIRSKPFNYHHLSQLRSDRQTFYTLVAPIKDHRRAFSGDVKRGRNLFRVTTHRAICRGQIKLGDEKKKKRGKSQHSRKLLFRRTIRGKINRSRDDPRYCHRFVVSNDIFDISMPARLSSLYVNDFFFFLSEYISVNIRHEAWSWEVRMDAILPGKMEKVFQKGRLRSRRMRKDLFQVSQFWKILRDWEKGREKSFGYSIRGYKIQMTL